MSAIPTTHILSAVDDVIYIEVTGSISKWETHVFSIDIQSPRVKNFVFKLKDTTYTI